MTDQTGRTRRFVRALKSKAWLWLLPPLIGFGGAVLWTTWTQQHYRSSALIALVPSKVPGSIVGTSTDTLRFEDRIPSIRNEILSRSRLERIIQDLDLYAGERRTTFTEEIVERMRSSVEIRLAGGDAVAVAFTGTDPRTTQRVADRLAALLIDEMTRDRKLLLENTNQFLQTTVRETKSRLTQAEKDLAKVQASGGPGGSLLAETIELEFLKEAYRKSLTQRHDSDMLANIERREIGEQFRQIDPARIPIRAVGPARSLVISVATLCGLAVGLILVALSSARLERPSSAEAEPA